MKMYLSTNQRKIGVVLADGKDVYFKKCYVSRETFPDSSALQGLKRGIILARNLLNPSKLEVITDGSYFAHPAQQRALKNDEMVRRYNNITYHDKTEKDEYFLQICRNMIKFEEMRERNGRNYSR